MGAASVSVPGKSKHEKSTQMMAQITEKLTGCSKTTTLGSQKFSGYEEKKSKNEFNKILLHTFVLTLLLTGGWGKKTALSF